VPAKAKTHNPGALTTDKRQRRRRRTSPPWGNILGGKPIERHAFHFGKKIDIGENARTLQFVRMLLLKRHYGIMGGDDVMDGLGGFGSWPWYQLALALASELDDSFKIIDGTAPGKTASRWRGVEGSGLVRTIEMMKKIWPNHSIPRHLVRLQKINPDSYGRMSLNELKARYYESKRHHGTK
jgi:hypothetical protein